MNYYQARRETATGKWRWTRQNDGVVWPSGGCGPVVDEAAVPDKDEQIKRGMRGTLPLLREQCDGP